MLRPDVAIPIHWGTLWPIAMRWRRHQLTEPPLRMAEAVAALGLDSKVVILPPGEAYDLSPAHGGAA
jgi:L-ascorbate metabolism protein UlaG (beta-lactamase superfamily)